MTINPDDQYFIIGIDGGATETTGFLFNHQGETLAKEKGSGTNLVISESSAPAIIRDMILNLCQKADVAPEYLDAIGLGLAGASNDTGRDAVFKELDRLKLSPKTLICSDAEAAFEVGCPIGYGILVSVGTGVICMGRNREGKAFRSGGLGHDKDMGSGFWIGRETLLKLAFEEQNVFGDKDLSQINDLITEQFEHDDLAIALDKVMASDNYVQKVASLTPHICTMAENENDLALGVIQEATMHVSDLILELTRAMEYRNDSILLLAGNGGVLSNKLYRKCLSDALSFHYKNIHWTFSELSPAYGAGILAARFNDIPVSLKDILKHPYEF